MKKFFKYCMLFMLPVLMVAAPLEYFIRQVPNSYKYKYEWMQKNAENVETLIFGSSHTLYGIRPQYLDGKAFNMANVNQELAQDWFLLNYWKDRYKKLKTIIVPVSYYPTWFSPGLEYGGEEYRCRYYKIYMDCDLYTDFSFSYNMELSDYRTAKQKIDKLLSGDKDTEYDVYGWSKRYLLSNKNHKTWSDGSEAENAVRRHKAKGFDNEEKNYGYMSEIAKFCKKYNIQLVLVSTPCWQTYHERLDKAQLLEANRVTRRFVEEFNVPYLDYFNDKRFEADDFFDSNHLSDIGAVKFTKILNEDLKKLK